ncbi:hypothetical protein CPB84DRAFT_1875702, partial [Gymnopilus junonius]
MCLQNPNKLICWSSVSFPDDSTYAYHLPTHKADHLFEGSHIHICCLLPNGPLPCPIFLCYLTSCDCLFPFNPELWLIAVGSIP